VRLRLESGYDADKAFSLTHTLVKSDVGDDADLVRVAAESLLDEAVKEWQRRSSGPSSDAAETARACVLELADLAVQSGDPHRSIDILSKGAELPFAVRERRELRARVAHLYADVIGDAANAVEVFRSVFDEDPADSVAESAVERFSELLGERGLDAER